MIKHHGNRNNHADIGTVFGRIDNITHDNHITHDNQIKQNTQIKHKTIFIMLPMLFILRQHQYLECLADEILLPIMLPLMIVIVSKKKSVCNANYIKIIAQKN